VTERVLFVHAHPDDESISTGATIASLIDRGAEVTVLTLTRGERGEVMPVDLQHLTDSPAELGEWRERELAEALGILGVTDHRILGSADARWEGREPRRYLDSGMSWAPSRAWGRRTARPGPLSDPDSLSSADPAEVASDIAAVIIDVEPDVVVTYAADGGYGHPDHITAHRAARLAAEVVGVPLYTIATAGRASLVVDALAVLDRKRAALAAHRTQVRVEGDHYFLSSGPARSLAAPERFGRLRAPGAFESATLGSKVGTAILAVLVGAFTGAVLTVAHRASVTILSVAVPWGLIAAIVITAALLIGLRVVFQTRVVAACAAVGLVAAIVALALGSGVGSVLVADNTIGTIFVGAMLAIAVGVLAWPRSGIRWRGNMGTPAAEGSDQK
jgi:N-acetyl-1-D-myo-inositol-2-amino-2-deoxy-alpha-D-glucopyranoside deacetylase